MAKRLISLALLMALLIGLSWTTALPGRAAGFAVDSNVDDASAVDKNPGDTYCRDYFNRCTLRAAIQETNALAGSDRITFKEQMYIYIDRNGEGALPPITEQVQIDASSVWDTTNDQPGVTLSGVDQTVTCLSVASTADNVEIHGLFVINCTNGLTINGHHNTVGAMADGHRNVFASNSNAGVLLTGPNSHHNTIQGNWMGLSITGDTKGPNAYGVQIANGAYNNLIGGDRTAEGNYLSGNQYYGLHIEGAGTDGNLVGANVIGQPAVGALEVGNGAAGVYIEYGAKDNRIGDEADSDTIGGNVISYNEGNGVYVWKAHDNWIENNVISNNKDYGVLINQSAGTQILLNIIAGNKRDGVQVWGVGATGNLIIGKSISNNGGKGIRLVNGGNSQLASPQVTLASPLGASGTGCSLCQIHVYSDDDDEGGTYQGTTNADANGDWVYAGSLYGPYVTATNTDAGNNTSEFSVPFGTLGTCEHPTPLACGQSVSGDTSRYANNLSSYSCSGDASGPEIIYTFELTAANSVQAELTNFTADFDLVLLEGTGCPSGKCLNSDSHSAVTLTVPDVPTGTYYLAVDAQKGISGTYDLELSCGGRGGSGATTVYLPLTVRNH